MRASWDLDAIHTSIAAAAVDPCCWTPALNKTALVTGAAPAALIPISTSDRPLGLTFTDSLAELMDGYTKEGWYKHDRRDQGIPKLQSTGITVDEDHTSLEEMRRSPSTMTSSADMAFNGLPVWPSCHFRPSRSVKLWVNPSGETFQSAPSAA